MDTNERIQRYEEEERAFMLALPILKPEITDLVLIPGGTFTVNDGWLTSGGTEFIFEVKRRNKCSTDATYINASKFRALVDLGKEEGRGVLFIDECKRSGDVNVWRLDLVEVDRIERLNYFHKASGTRRADVVAYFTPGAGLVDSFFFPSYL